MELIQFHSDKTLLPQFTHQLFHSNNMQSKSVAQKIHIDNCCRQFLFFMDSVLNYILITKVKVPTNCSQTTVTTSFFVNNILQCTSDIQILLINKFILKINKSSRDLTFKLHPFTGQLSFDISFLIHSKNSQEYLFQTLTNILEDYKLDINRVYRKIFYILNKQLKITEITESENQAKELENLKEYLISCNQYSWNVLLESTSCNKQKSKKVSLELKKRFRQLYKYEKISEISKNLVNVAIQPVSKIQKFIELTSNDDNQIYQKYLSEGFSTNKNSKLVNQITVNQQDYNNLFKKGASKIECSQLGSIKVAIKIFNESFINRLKYQRSILQKLPRYQFIGIPKYYYIKNIKDSERCVITSLINIKSLNKFMKSNRRTLSIQTKLFILKQIANTLRYFRQSSMVYHALMQNNIGVKKGIITTTIDFTNAYYQNITEKAPILINNKFPYVVNYKNQYINTYKDQRSDVFSFGLLAYQLLIGKNQFDIRQTFFLQPSKQTYLLRKIFKNPVMAIEKINFLNLKILSLILQFSYLAVSFQIPITTQTEYLQQDVNVGKKLISNRPYLDWCQIISTYCLNYFDQNF